MIPKSGNRFSEKIMHQGKILDLDPIQFDRIKVGAAVSVSAQIKMKTLRPGRGSIGDSYLQNVRLLSADVRTPGRSVTPRR
jgi:hypothetical protein